MLGEPRFARPPVREVELTILFEPLETLQTLTLAPLRVDWSEDYPKLSEVAPRPSSQERGRESVKFVPTEGSWPMPLCTFISTDGNRAIQVQNDMFGITWSFDAQSPTYPGFEALRQELCAKFTEFERLVGSALGIEVKVTEVSTSYLNHVEGMPAEDLCLGVLTGWTVEPRATQESSIDYAGIRVHHCASDNNQQTSLLIGVDTAVSEAEDDGPAATLRLQGERMTDSSKVVTESLSIVHDILLAKFLQLTTPEMRERWGEDR